EATRQLACAFFFQAEDGVRDCHVTGVQTCALPISRAWVAGVSLGDRRILNIAGTNIKLFVWPDQLLERSVDTPAPGTYKVVCEEGCDDGWSGAVRIEVADMPIPWVESRDTDAAAQVNRRAPDFAVYDLEGRVVQLSDFRGE